MSTDPFIVDSIVDQVLGFLAGFFGTFLGVIGTIAATYIWAGNANTAVVEDRRGHAARVSVWSGPMLSSRPRKTPD